MGMGVLSEGSVVGRIAYRTFPTHLVPLLLRQSQRSMEGGAMAEEEHHSSE